MASGVNGMGCRLYCKRDIDVKIVDIKIAKSSFMGYGLYEKNMMNLDYAINML